MWSAKIKVLSDKLETLNTEFVLELLLIEDEEEYVLGRIDHYLIELPEPITYGGNEKTLVAKQSKPHEKARVMPNSCSFFDLIGKLNCDEGYQLLNITEKNLEDYVKSIGKESITE